MQSPKPPAEGLIFLPGRGWGVGGGLKDSQKRRLCPGLHQEERMFPESAPARGSVCALCQGTEVERGLAPLEDCTSCALVWEEPGEDCGMAWEAGGELQRLQGLRQVGERASPESKEKSLQVSLGRGGWGESMRSVSQRWLFMGQEDAREKRT